MLSIWFGLWLSAVTSATILPGSSEMALASLLHLYPEYWLTALLVATFGNSVGSMVSYAMGRLIPNPIQHNLIQPNPIQPSDKHHATKADVVADTTADKTTVMAANAPVSDKQAKKQARQQKAMLWLQKWGTPACFLRGYPLWVMHCPLLLVGCVCKCGKY